MRPFHSIFALSALTSAAAFRSTQNGTQFVKLGLNEGRKMQTNALRQEQEQDQMCSICSRIGSPFLPERQPYPDNFGFTCGYLQENTVGIHPSDSDECDENIDLFEDRCCQQAHELQSYECVTNVRSSILNDSYDKNVAPVQSVDYELQPLEVETLVTYFAVKEVDVISNALEIFVSVELTWNDPRLRWDHNSTTNCATEVHAKADHSSVESEIWSPTLEVVNRADGIQDFPSPRATVKSDGTVTWERLGSLRAICAFIGLRRMPFDNLGCRLVFEDDDGLNTIDYKLKETSNNRTNGFRYWDVMEAVYSEFSIINEMTETSYSSQSPGVFYIDLYFQRARRHYVMFILLPNILFTYIAFGQFVFEIHSSDRMGFSVTVVLIIVTQSVLTATFLPVCNELLWMNAFNLVSMLFALVATMESLTVFKIHRLILSKRGKKGEHEGKEIEGEEEYMNLISEDVDDGSDDDARLDTNLEEGKEEEGLDEKKDVPPDQPSSLPAALDIPENTHASQDQRRSSTGHHEEVSLSSEKKQATMTRFKKSTAILRAITTKPKGLAEWIERIDMYCLFVFTTSYSIFVTAMFIRNYLWEDEKIERWMP